MFLSALFSSGAVDAHELTLRIIDSNGIGYRLNNGIEASTFNLQ